MCELFFIFSDIIQIFLMIVGLYYVIFPIRDDLRKTRRILEGKCRNCGTVMHKAFDSKTGKCKVCGFTHLENGAKWMKQQKHT